MRVFSASTRRMAPDVVPRLRRSSGIAGKMTAMTWDRRWLVFMVFEWPRAAVMPDRLADLTWTPGQRKPRRKYKRPDDRRDWGAAALADYVGAGQIEYTNLSHHHLCTRDRPVDRERWHGRALAPFASLLLREVGRLRPLRHVDHVTQHSLELGIPPVAPLIVEGAPRLVVVDLLVAHVVGALDGPQ